MKTVVGCVKSRQAGRQVRSEGHSPLLFGDPLKCLSKLHRLFRCERKNLVLCDREAVVKVVGHTQAQPTAVTNGGLAYLGH